MAEMSTTNAAEQALQEWEIQYRYLFNNAQDLIHIVDANGRIIDANDTELSVLGYKRKEYIGKALTSIIHPDCMEATKKAFARVMQGKTIQAYETAFITHGGKKIEIEASVTPRLKAGKIVSTMAICRDITQRKQAEKKLHETDIRFIKMVQTAPDAIISIDENQRITLFNKGAENTFGYQPDEILGRSLDLIIPERFRDIHHKEVADFATGYEANRYMGSKSDITCLKKNGEEFVSEASISKMEVSGAMVMSVILRDVSERNKITTALAESEIKFRTLADSATVGIFLFREHFLYTNPKCSEMSGYSQEQLLHMGITDLLHPDSADGVLQNWAKRKQGDNAARHCDVKFITRNGSIRWGQLTTALIKFQSLPTSIGSVVDITDRIHAQQELHKANARITSLSDNLPGGVLFKNQHGLISYANRAFCDMFSIPASPETIIGTDCALTAEETKHLFADPEEFLASIKTAENQQELIIRQEISLADGRTFEYDYVPILVDNNLFGHLWHYRDITASKQKERAILRLSEENGHLAQQILKAQEQERQNIARELHDELGQSLTMIKTELGRVASHREDSKKLAKIIRTIDEATDHVIASTRTLLQKLRPDMLDSIGLTAALTELMKKWAAQYEIPCTFDLSENLDTLNDNIQLTLYRILQESLTNIVRHARATRVQVHCHMPSVNHSDPYPAITLIISDDGIGRKQSDTPQHGLGLAGIRERVQSLGGNMEIKSNPNQGMRIIVSIPQRQKNIS